LDKLGILLPNLVIYIINFVLIMWLLKMFVYGPVTKILNERRERIRESLAEAERVKEQAAAERAQLEAQFAEERRTMVERQREAASRSEEAANRRLAEASAEAEAIVSRAREEAASTRAGALSGLQNEIADLALRAAAKVLQEGVDEQRHRALVAKFLRDELGDLA
jgi:F-type H+-transporting ATPase subunit b